MHAKIIIAAVAVLAVVAAPAQAGFPELPKLNTIMSKQFSTPYSCNGSYNTSALFLSEYSDKVNDPELLLNGACNSPKYLEAATAGDDFGLFCELDLADLTNATSDAIAKCSNGWSSEAPVVVGKVYALMRSSWDSHMFAAVRIVHDGADGTHVEYAVRMYDLFEGHAKGCTLQSANFSWTATNTDGPVAPYVPSSFTPPLNELLSFEMPKSYSCGGNYTTSAVFLSRRNKVMNDPDGLFNGACGSTPYFEAATAGNDFALLADLTVDAQITDVHTVTMTDIAQASKSWATEVDVVQGHVYGVWRFTERTRTFYTFGVTSLDGDRLAIRLAVKDFVERSEQPDCVAVADGFNWDQPNSPSA